MHVQRDQGERDQEEDGLATPPAPPRERRGTRGLGPRERCGHGGVSGLLVVEGVEHVEPRGMPATAGAWASSTETPGRASTSASTSAPWPTSAALTTAAGWEDSGARASMPTLRRRFPAGDSETCLELRRGRVPRPTGSLVSRGAGPPVSRRDGPPGLTGAAGASSATPGEPIGGQVRDVVQERGAGRRRRDAGTGRANVCSGKPRGEFLSEMLGNREKLRSLKSAGNRLRRYPSAGVVVPAAAGPSPLAPSVVELAGGNDASAGYPVGNRRCRNVPVATACHGNRCPAVQRLCTSGEESPRWRDRHGKEGVAGSSPAEGFTNPAAARFSRSWSGSGDHFLDAQRVAGPGERGHMVRRARDRGLRCARPRRDHPPSSVGRVLSGYRSES